MNHKKSEKSKININVEKQHFFSKLQEIKDLIKTNNLLQNDKKLYVSSMLENIIQRYNNDEKTNNTLIKLNNIEAKLKNLTQ